jgi:ABC-2 type transport system ATP-binding protein
MYTEGRAAVTHELAIEAIALHKRYGTVPFLAGFDLRLPRGNALALLGPNGAGKTTTVRILSTLIRADAGTARVAGFEVVAERHQVRRRISLTGQYAALDLLQTGEENLRMVGRLRGLERVQARRRARELLERLDVPALREQRLRSLYTRCRRGCAGSRRTSRSRP